MTVSIAEAASRLRGKARGNTILCPGPGHSRHDRSLKVIFKADGFSVTSFAGDDWRDCKDYVRTVLGLSDDRPMPVPANDHHVDVAALKRRQNNAFAIWARSLPISGTLVEAYLASRGLSYGGDALRFWPGGRAMVALITDATTGEPCGLHRTFLDRHGAKIGRKMLGRAAGGVVRLHGDEEVTTGLGIAEGIETALATNHSPVWACLSAGSMASLPVLPGIETLSVFADADRAGINAANAVGERWHAAGCEVVLMAPERGDFADLAVA